MLIKIILGNFENGLYLPKIKYKFGKTLVINKIYQQYKPKPKQLWWMRENIN